MELELFRRYGGLAIGAAVALLLVWWTSRSRLAATLGIPARSPRYWLSSALAALGGFALFVVLAETARWVLLALAVIGLPVVTIMAGIEARRRPYRPLPRTDLLLQWAIPITLVLLGLGFGIRLFAGPGIAFGLVAGLGLGMLPGLALLALFTLVTRLARAAAPRLTAR